MKKFRIGVLTFAIISSCFGNVGVFRGSGQTPTLEKNAEIQMVEEVVEMRPRRGAYPVDGSCRNPDLMDFSCRFLLRNLSDKQVELTVGFPVSTEALFIRPGEEVNQTQLVSHFRFVAGTCDRTFPVRFAPWDRNRKFSNIFLWKMSFAPKEELWLYVNYTMEGYMGLAATSRDGVPPEAEWPFMDRYSGYINMAMGEIQFYVTGTGSCWAGNIEKAVFRYYPLDFEEYLSRRGMEEVTDEQRAMRASGKKRDPDTDFVRLTRGNRRFLRVMEPAAEEWKFLPGKRRHESCFELTRAPFSPKSGDKISIGYLFPMLPENIGSFEALGNLIETQLTRLQKDREKMFPDLEKLKKEDPERWKYWSQAPKVSELPEIRRGLADIVLEYHGVETNNPKIRPYLRQQRWYPVKDAPPLDGKYREFLLEVSRGEVTRPGTE